MIWLILVAAVFVAGGAWLVARSWATRGIVLVAGIVAAGGYLLLGHPNMRDEPLAGRLDELEARAASTPDELTAEQVLAILKERARKSPRQPQPQKAIGDFYAQAGRLDDAMLSYSAALRRDPTYRPALDAISELEFQTSGVVDPATLERLPEIRERARAAPESLTNVQLMALLEERAKVAPDDPMPHRLMGQILQGVGQTDKAEAAYRAVLKLNPNDRDALKSLADVRFKASGKIDPETAELYHKAYRLDRSDLRVGYMAGIGDWLQGKKAEAEALWASIEANPANDATHRQMFVALRQMFKIDPAPPEPSKTEGGSAN